MDLCSTGCGPAELTGAFDRTNDQNPWKDYTVLHVLYCSGR